MAVNSNVKYTYYTSLLNESNSEELLFGANIVIDAVDNVSTRFLLQKICKKLNVPLVHGSIGGWYGQVSFIIPGDDTLSLIYPSENIHGIEKELGNPAFTPAVVASIEVSEALKYLLNKGELLQKKLLYINLLSHDYTVIELDSNNVSK